MQLIHLNKHIKSHTYLSPRLVHESHHFLYKIRKALKQIFNYQIISTLRKEKLQTHHQLLARNKISTSSSSSSGSYNPASYSVLFLWSDNTAQQNRIKRQQEPTFFGIKHNLAQLRKDCILINLWRKNLPEQASWICWNFCFASPSREGVLVHLSGCHCCNKNTVQTSTHINSTLIQYTD